MPRSRECFASAAILFDCRIITLELTASKRDKPKRAGSFHQPYMITTV